MPPPLAVAIVLSFAVVWLLIVGAMLLLLYGSATIRVPFVPIATSVVETLKRELPLSPGDVLYDLGSGDGRVVFGMAEAYPAAHVIGIEKGPFPYLASRFKQRLAGPGTDNTAFLFEDFSRVPLGDATHLYLYLYPDVVQELLPKLRSELKPGTTVASCDFPFSGLEPYRTVPVVRGARKHTLYFYRF